MRNLSTLAAEWNLTVTSEYRTIAKDHQGWLYHSWNSTLTHPDGRTLTVEFRQGAGSLEELRPRELPQPQHVLSALLPICQHVSWGSWEYEDWARLVYGDNPSKWPARITFDAHARMARKVRGFLSESEFASFVADVWDDVQFRDLTHFGTGLSSVKRA